MASAIIKSTFQKFFVFGHVNSGSGIPKFFTVLPVCEPGIIVVFMGNHTVADLFRAAITDIRGFIKPWAEFLLKVLTGLIAGGAGSAFHTAQDKKATDMK